MGRGGKSVGGRGAQGAEEAGASVGEAQGGGGRGCWRERRWEGEVGVLAGGGAA
jgi:hypothetical protein